MVKKLLLRLFLILSTFGEINFNTLNITNPKARYKNTYKNTNKFVH